MKLLIVESPGKIEKLTGILGGDWKVAASVGHIRDMPEREIGVAPPNFTPVYELTERGRGVADKLKKLVASASDVYLATDPDREGESIAWHLQQVLALKNPKRCTFNDINAGPVKNAVANPRSIDIKLVTAQEARRVLDRLVGYTVSPVLSRQSGQRMSAGRVQSPAVRLVVERERAIENFKVTQHFGAVVHFAEGWTAEWNTASLYSKEPHYCLDQAIAARVAAATAFTVKEAEDKAREQNPSPPFTTSTLQQAASARLKMNPKLTMETAQKLYEQGAITYHRTDSPNLSEDGYREVAAYGLAKKLPIVSPQRRFKAKADAQEAHEAIRPSHIEDENAGSTEAEQQLYQLIRNRTLASQLPAARFAVRAVVLTTVIGGKEVAFKARGEKMLEPGWTLIYADRDSETDSEDEAPNPLPKLVAGQAITAVRGEVLNKKTKPPKRYTEASLVKELETQGIGRPSTYAAIMEKIASSGYVVADKKQFLSATELAKSLVDSLVDAMSFIELGFTREMESRLDDIAEGKGSYRAVIGQLHSDLNAELGRIRVSVPQGTPTCPSCKSVLRRLKSEHGFYWGCTGYPDCKVTLPDEKGRPGQPKAAPVVSAHACPACGKGLIHRHSAKQGKKDGFDFWGCSGYPSCKTSLPNKGGKPDLAAYKGVAQKKA